MDRVFRKPEGAATWLFALLIKGGAEWRPLSWTVAG
jgi:hypothetical protein